MHRAHAQIQHWQKKPGARRFRNGHGAAFAEWLDNGADRSMVGSQAVYDSLEEYDLPLCK
jgi:hypothetical protein